MMPLIEAKGLTKGFVNGGEKLSVLDGADLSIGERETLGLVGESGCGKSTLARVIARLVEPDGGELLYRGRDITHIKGKELRGYYKKVQMVFQNPASSFDPRRTIGYSVAESLLAAGADESETKRRTAEMLALCGLSPEIAARYPHQVSGGQAQRAQIARALISEPELLICDEATSSLDAIVQKRVIVLLRAMREKRPLGILFICHDAELVREFCTRVLIMENGRIAESGKADVLERKGQ